MNDQDLYNSVLDYYMHRAKMGNDRLAKATDIAKENIARWRRGETKRIRNRIDLLKIAHVLKLTETEATNLLQAYEQPTIAELLQHPTEAEKPWLNDWVHYQRIHLYLDDKSLVLTTESRQTFLESLADSLGITAADIRVYQVQEAHPIFELGMPLEAFQQLRFLITVNSEQLRILKIKHIILVEDLNRLEHWGVQDGEFRQVSQPIARSSEVSSEQLDSASGDELAEFQGQLWLNYVAQWFSASQIARLKLWRLRKIYLVRGGILFIVVLVGIGIYTTISRNEPPGLLAGAHCLPPPPARTVCPLAVTKPLTHFPTTIRQCQEVQNTFFMQTDVTLDQTGKLRAYTEVVSDHHLFGFSGRATIYLCQGHVALDQISNRWGVQGRAIPGAASHRRVDWDCPKGTALLKERCRKNEGPQRNIIDPQLLSQIAYIQIIQERDPSKGYVRLENAVKKMRQIFGGVRE